MQEIAVLHKGSMIHAVGGRLSPETCRSTVTDDGLSILTEHARNPKCSTEIRAHACHHYAEYWPGGHVQIIKDKAHVYAKSPGRWLPSKPIS